MALSSSTTWRPMPTYLYACMLAASNRQVPSRTRSLQLGMPHPSAHQHGANSSIHVHQEGVFNDAMSSHLVFPCFFSASSRARVHSSRGIIDASFPPASTSQVAVSYSQGIVLVLRSGGSRPLEGLLPAQHSARPDLTATLPGQISGPWKGASERAPRATWPAGH